MRREYCRHRFQIRESMGARGSVIVYYIVLNILGLASMASDKIRMMERRFRIPESVLLIIALIGGAAGSTAGMYIFRHKKKRPLFAYGLPFLVFAHIFLWVLLYVSSSAVVFM